MKKILLLVLSFFMTTAFIGDCSGGRKALDMNDLPSNQVSCDTISSEVLMHSVDLDDFTIASDLVATPDDYCNFLERYASVKVALEGYLASAQKDCQNVLQLKAKFESINMADKLVTNISNLSHAPFYTRTLFHIQDSDTGHGWVLPDYTLVFAHMVTLFPRYYQDTVNEGGLRDKVFLPLYRCSENVPIDLAATLFAKSAVKYLMLTIPSYATINYCEQSYFATKIKNQALTQVGTLDLTLAELPQPPYTLYSGCIGQELEQLEQELNSTL